jgi:NAD-dependent SIR2 family protein deacetylase
MNTRASFRKNPLSWYRDFWIPLQSQMMFTSAATTGSCHNNNDNDTNHQKEEYNSTTTTPQYCHPQPNVGHAALETLLLDDVCGESLTVISQNIDGLLDTNNNKVIEAHGRLGYYKCIPPEDSDTDSEDDEDDDRLVHLGHRRKSRALRRLYQEQQQQQQNHCASGDQHDDDDNTVGPSNNKNNNKQVGRVPCKYEFLESIPLNQVQPPSARSALRGMGEQLATIPRCPQCKSPIAPQALLFDEGYHSHSWYQFERMERAIEECHILIFVGTSFHVCLSQVALAHARRSSTIRVYNFNTLDVLEPTSMLNVHNIVGPCEEKLVRLVDVCLELKQEQRNQYEL